MAHIALYARVSTGNQSTGLESQIRALTAYCTVNQITDYVVYQDEGISGSKASRPALDKMMEAVRQGQVASVIVFSFSRFARSTKHLLAALELFNNKGVRFASLSEQIDTATTTGKFVFSILASVSELERELIRERVVNGLNNCKAKGIKLGRPKQISNLQLIQHLAEQNLSYKEIAKLASCSPATVCRALKATVSKSVA